MSQKIKTKRNLKKKRSVEKILKKCVFDITENYRTKITDCIVGFVEFVVLLSVASVVLVAESEASLFSEEFFFFFFLTGDFFVSFSKKI